MKKQLLTILFAAICLIATAQPGKPGNYGNPGNPQHTPTHSAHQPFAQPNAHRQPQGHQFSSIENVRLVVICPRGERFWLYINDMPKNNQSDRMVMTNLKSNMVYNIQVVTDGRNREEISEYVCFGGDIETVVLTLESDHGRTRLWWKDEKIESGANRYTYIWEAKAPAHNGQYISGRDILTLTPQAPNPPAPQPTPPAPRPNPQHNPQPTPPSSHQNIQPTPPAPQPCPPEEFRRLKELVKDQSFENNRLNVAKQACHNRLLTTDQIGDLTGLFDFENTKLEFLKYAYDSCFDKQNYLHLVNVLEYSSSRNELTKFLQKKN